MRLQIHTWHRSTEAYKSRQVLSFIKFSGVIVAAIWFGGTVFFTFFAAPAFFTPEMKQLLPPPYNGEVAQMLLQRYYLLHYIVGVVALVHLGFEWIYTGRTVQRLTLGLVSGTLLLALFGGLWMHPKLEKLHQIKYSEQYRISVTPEARKIAIEGFKIWHGISQLMNLMLLGALGGYLWQMMNPKEGPKYLGGGKFNIDKHL